MVKELADTKPPLALAENKRYYEDLAMGPLRPLLDKMNHGNPAAEEIVRIVLAKHLSNIHKALALIESTHDRMKIAKEAKKNTVYVTEQLVEGTDYLMFENSGPPFEIKLEWLLGPARIAFEYFNKVGLNPKIDDYPHVIRIKWENKLV